MRDFQYIATIADLKSFSKAAKKCFVSQPALSQQVQKIENELGIRIFHRTKNDTHPTPKGNMVLKLSQQILETFQKIQNISSEIESVRIGLIPTVCPYLLPHILKDLNSSMPSIKFYFSELKTKDLLKSIKDGVIDIGILSFVDDILEFGLFNKKLYDEPFLFAVNKESDMTAKDFDTALKYGQLILLEEGNCMSDNILNICSRYSSYLFNDFYATNIETVKSMIKMKNGVGLLPFLSCLREADLNFFQLEEAWHREVCIVSQSKKNPAKYIEEISGIISQKTSELLQRTE